MGRLQLILGWIVLIVNISSLVGLHTALYNEDLCHHNYGVKDVSGRFDFKAMTEHKGKVLEKTQTLQLKLEYDVLNMDKDEEQLGKSNVSKLKFKKYLEEEVVQLLYGARVALRHIQFPRVKGIRNTVSLEEPLINDFMTEEIRKYITPKENKNGKVNIFRTGRIYNIIGHAGVLVKKELENSKWIMILGPIAKMTGIPLRS